MFSKFYFFEWIYVYVFFLKYFQSVWTSGQPGGGWGHGGRGVGECLAIGYRTRERMLLVMCTYPDRVPLSTAAAKPRPLDTTGS